MKTDVSQNQSFLLLSAKGFTACRYTNHIYPMFLEKTSKVLIKEPRLELMVTTITVCDNLAPGPV